MKKRNKNGEAAITEPGVQVKAARPKRKRKKAPVIIAAVVIAIIIFRAVACSSGDNVGAVVTTANAVRGDLQENISTNGTVKSEEVSVIFAPVSGTLDSVNVAAGDAVEAGDILATYNMARLESSMRQSELQYEKSNANYSSVMADNAQNQAKLNEATINLDVLERQIEDTKAYIKTLQNELSESQRHTSNALAEESMNLSNSLREKTDELENLQAQLKDGANPSQIQPRMEELSKEIEDIQNAISRNSYVSSTASNSDYVAELQQKISDAQDLLQHYETYKAEMEGQKTSTENSVLDSYDRASYSADKELAEITYRESEEDYDQAKDGIHAAYAGIITECTAVSGSGVASGTHLMTLESSENVKVTFYASKYDLAKLEIGQKVDVTISGNVYEGAISKINRMAETNASNTPMVGVEVHLLAPDDRIILGMDAKLLVYTRKAEDTLMIPVEAINADKEGDFLYVVENGIVAKKPIVCGISTDTYTEVLEGITEEDVIIVTSYTNLEEGMPVTAIPAQ
ncbi:MAG: efflux RND transporter periplasmic adaptor subunit [Eubacterium sp.]|nr:efflux RND transporter periplasmic adaptor subunit [Eubacterium sp.]